MLSMHPIGGSYGGWPDWKTVQQGVEYAKDVANAVQQGCTILQPGSGTAKSVCDTVKPPPPPATPGSMALVDLTKLQRGVSKYPPGSLVRFNTDTNMWSVYVPMSGVLAGTPFGKALGETSDVVPPPPAGTRKGGDEAAQPAGTTNVGTEHNRRWYTKPIYIGGVLVGVGVLVGGAWLLLR